MISLAHMYMFFYSPTYFVEYQFPAVLHHPGAARAAAVGRRKLPGSYELMRIASKKMKDGGMYSVRSVGVMYYLELSVQCHVVSLATCKHACLNISILMLVVLW